MGPYYESLKNRPVALDLLKVLRTGKPANWGSRKDEKDWHKAMETEEFATAVHRRDGLPGRVSGAGGGESRVDLSQQRHAARHRGRLWRLRVLARRRIIRQLSAAVFEKPPVDRSPRARSPIAGCSEKVAVVAGDMLAAPLPADADVHLYSNVLHDWDEPVVRQLLSKSFDALPPPGLHRDPRRVSQRRARTGRCMSRSIRSC